MRLLQYIFLLLWLPKEWGLTLLYRAPSKLKSNTIPICRSTKGAPSRTSPLPNFCIVLQYWRSVLVEFNCVAPSQKLRWDLMYFLHFLMVITYLLSRTYTIAILTSMHIQICHLGISVSYSDSHIGHCLRYDFVANITSSPVVRAISFLIWAGYHIP